jgi:acid phosphatase type 7
MKRNSIFLRILAIFAIAILVSAYADRRAMATDVSIIKGPYLQNVTSNSIVIMWETNVPSDSTVFLNGIPVSDSAEELATIHEVPLTGLIPDTPYSYYVESGSISSDPLTFKTAPSGAQAFRFAVVGDTQLLYPNTTALDYVVNGIIKQYPEPDLLLHVGDIVTSGASATDWATFFTHAHDLLTYTPMFPTPGNHEYMYDPGAPNFFKYFSLPPPTEPSDGIEHGWYAFSYGNILFISLNSEVQSTDQDTWLEAQLKSATEKWIIVYFHEPPYTDALSGDGNIYIRNNWVPFFQYYGVNLVFSGHTHDYERYEDLVYGTTYIVAGGGNNIFSAVNSRYTPPPGIVKKAVKTSTIHYCTVDVDVAGGGSLAFNAWVASSGISFDYFKITTVPTHLKVESIATGTVSGTKSGFVYGIATIRVVDEYGNPVSGAAVEGYFTGDFADRFTGVKAGLTNSSGFASFKTSKQLRSPSVGFTVKNVTKQGMTYP